MADEKGREEWSRHAILCYYLVQPHSKRRLRPALFNPYERAQEKVTAGWVKTEGAKLPETLSDEEIRRRYEEYVSELSRD